MSEGRSSVVASQNKQGSALLHVIYSETARWTPHATALVIPPSEERLVRKELTYQQLDQLANGYATQLEPYCQGECIVALLVPRTSEHLWAAQLGAMRVGAAYTCLDPELPDEVIRRTLQDADPVSVVADPHDRDRLQALLPDHVPVLLTSEFSATLHAPEVAAFGDDRLAYLIYTSGTTGIPKGVMIEHRSIANLVRSDLAEFSLGPGDRVAQGSSASYDSSIEETWLAFASGATLVVMDDETVRLGPDLIPWLHAEQITVLCPPPTLLRTTGCDDPRNQLPHLRLLYVGGEALTSDIADVWAPGRRLENGYGPTECTVTCVRTPIRANKAITIGKPIPGMSAWVLDENLVPVPEGESGELCLGGVGLARGYRNSPEVTAKKFVEHPEFGRIYRTGDLVRLEPDENLTYFGRIDSQIKLRGYRIELEAIEAVIAGFPGIREAACKLQRESGREWLSAHIVLANEAPPIELDELRHRIADSLPSYMVPTAFGFTDSLPKSIGGKIRRDTLGVLFPHHEHIAAKIVLASTPQEIAVTEACAKVLGSTDPISIEDDFFTDLGGSSLLAAQLVSLLRADPSTAAITVRDIYEARTIQSIALRALPSQHRDIGAMPKQSRVSHWPATIAQTILLILELVVGSAAASWVVIHGLGWLDNLIGLASFLLVWPILIALCFILYAPLSVCLAAGIKRSVIGRYETARVPVWGDLYLRNWIVRQVIRIVPWRQFEGTEFASIALRALGAKIGKRVHFHHGALPLAGGWDLLEIGDDVTICQDALLNLVDLDSGQMVFGSIQIGTGSIVGTRAVVAPSSEMGCNSTLSCLSSLASGCKVPDDAKWDGVRAIPAGRTSRPASCSQRSMSPLTYGMTLVASKAILGLIEVLPLQMAILVAYLQLSQGKSGVDDIFLDLGVVKGFGLAIVLTLTSMPLMLTLQATISRCLGTVKPGVIPLRSIAYVRIWIKSLLVESSGRWLSGTLFWPFWLRLAGMKIGRDCEISTIIDVVPDLVKIDSHVFFADGIYLGPPDIQQGIVTLGQLNVSSNTFVGNHSVLPTSQTLPEDILIGVCTVADSKVMVPGSSWFGMPPMELPRREIVVVDESLTHRPSPARYWNRVFWESLRFLVPAVPLYAFVVWYEKIVELSLQMKGSELYMVGAPIVTLGLAVALCLLILVMKWGLLGRVKEGVHPLWSCWCSRWDYLYVVWGEWARPILVSLEGTVLLIPYLRAMGMKIGKRVVLSSGFSHVVDPDMIEIGDDATVSAAYQAHTFEDRVLKIGKVVVEKGATLGRFTVPLYGAIIGERTHVAANSVIMKHEHLLPGHHYEGAPTHPIRDLLK